MSSSKLFYFWRFHHSLLSLPFYIFFPLSFPQLQVALLFHLQCDIMPGLQRKRHRVCCCTKLRCHRTTFWRLQMLSFSSKHFVSSRPAEPAQRSFSNNAEDGIRSCAHRSNVNKHLYRTLHIKTKNKMYSHYISSDTIVFTVNRTDDLVKKLLSLELASHVSSHVPTDWLIMSYSVLNR